MAFISLQKYLMRMYCFLVTLVLVRHILLPWLMGDGHQRRPEYINHHHSSKHHEHGWKITSITNNHIAIGCAVTGKGITGLTEYNMGTMHPFFKDLLASFCRTASSGYFYHFYISHDHGDPFFAGERAHVLFEEEFVTMTDQLCPKAVSVDLHFVECSHTGKPAWAQNDAMIEAYLDDMPYYYRVNDDTRFSTASWTELFIAALSRMDPPNVGVVGPNHIGGNEHILTYDFVHKTHIDIFGVYYPRLFTDWFADQWITQVYEPERMNKLHEVHIIHTMQAGTRYIANKNLAEKFAAEIIRTKAILSRWLEAKKDQSMQKNNSTNNVISFSLYGHNAKYLYGAVRNAQLIPVVYPGWKMRVYLLAPTNNTSDELQVPIRVLHKLQSLGVEIVNVQRNVSEVIPPMMWRFLVSDDLSVDTFIVRDVDSRLTDRERIAVEEWLKTDKAFHCIRDHPSHSVYAVSGGLFGGRPRKLKSIIGRTWQNLMISSRYQHEYLQDMNFITKEIWPKVKNDSVCHDSFSCEKYDCKPFPVKREQFEHVGQVFDEFGEPSQNDIDILAQKPVMPNCVSNSVTLPHGKQSHNDLPQEILPVPEFDLKRTLTLLLVDNNEKHVAEFKSLLELHGVNIITSIQSEVCYKEKDESCIEIFKQKIISMNEETDMILCLGSLDFCNLHTKGSTINKLIVIITEHTWDSTVIDPQDTAVSWHLLKDAKYVIPYYSYDAEYIHYIFGIHPVFARPTCMYLKDFYKPNGNNVLLYTNEEAHGLNFLSTYFMELFRTDSRLSSFKLTLKQLPKTSIVNDGDLNNFTAVIFLPMQLRSWTFIELYRMSIPIFMPSLALLTQWQNRFHIINDTSQFHYIQDTDMGYDIPNPAKHRHQEPLRYWLKRTDYYTMPHVSYFNSMEEFAKKFFKSDFVTLNSFMTTFNSYSLTKTVTRWKEIFSEFQ